MKPTAVIFRGWPAAAALLLSAVVAQAAPAPSRPAPEDALARRTPGKPVAPIAIDYELLGEPRVGEPLRLQIRVRPEQALTRLTFGVDAQAGLTVTPLELPAAGPVAAGESIARTLVVTPLEPGAWRVTLLVQGEGGTGSLARVVSIPIRTAAPGSASKPKAAGSLKEDRSGRTVVSLPAQESR
jgi:hypothetical protein